MILNNLAYVSAGHIAAVPADRIKGERDETEQQDYINVSGLVAAQEQFTMHGAWPGANGWGRKPSETVTPSDLARFHDIVRAMVGT